ncbi:hypothetical protein B0T13DRAFT_264701 [Neurospora crassa]|nr:hypothetical protein B0T13DRAFT_264701 [Neurospora crassa]
MDYRNVSIMQFNVFGWVMATHRSRTPDITTASTRLKEIRGRLSDLFSRDYLGGLQTVCQQDDRHSKTDGHPPFRGRTNRCGKYTAISRPRDISTKLDLQLHVAACSGTPKLTTGYRMRENSDTAIGSSIRISACLKSQMSPDAWAVTNDLDTQPENLFSVNHKLYRSTEFCAWMASEDPRRTILTSRVDAEVLFQMTFESGRSQKYCIPSLSSCNNFRLRPAIEPFFSFFFFFWSKKLLPIAS